MYRNMARWAVFAGLLAVTLTPAFGQAGCYFGVCPGDVGTEFPEQPTARLPAPPPMPQPPTGPSPTPQPAPQATPLPTEIPGMNKVRLDALCRSTIYIEGKFTWRPAMGTRNALAICEAALRNRPNDPEIRFAYAVARDMFSENGGTPADNFYAVTEYRELMAEGYPLAAYALATMHDEDAGVSKAEAIAYMSMHQSNGSADPVYCSILDEQAFFLELAGGRTLTQLMAEMEQGARNSFSCSRNVMRALWNTFPRFSFTIPFEAHTRAAAVRGDMEAMKYLGYLYANGSQYNWVANLKPHVTVAKDPERGGFWFLLSYYMGTLNLGVRAQEEWWGRSFFSDPNDSRAMQTALRSLGFYDGAIDGAFGPKSRAALESFANSNMADDLFQRLRAAEMIHPLLPAPEPIRIGSAALLE